MAECTVLLERVKKEYRSLKRSGLAVLVVATTVILLAASAVAQGGVPGGVNTPPSGLSGNATQIRGKDVDAPATLGQIPFYNGTKIGWFIDPIVRMNRDCGIVGSGDETVALNTCIANLPDYAGVLQCDKPGMAIHSTGVVVRNHIGIRIETAVGGHTLNNGCQLIYTGSAGGTVVDVERTRDSVIFKGFTIYAGAADIAFQTGQTGSGGNISSSDSFEEMQVNNNNGRSTFVAFQIGDSTQNNSDEMKFNHVVVVSNGCTECGTAFQDVYYNVYGTEFKDIVLINLAVGWNWASNASVDKVNGYYIKLLYNIYGYGSFHVQHEDLELVEQILNQPSGSNRFVEQNGRVVFHTPAQGGVMGTAGHPVWSVTTGSMKVHDMNKQDWSLNTGLVLLHGSTLSGRADIDFYDPGLTTFAQGEGGSPANPLANGLATGFQNSVGGAALWAGRGFIDEKGMMVPGLGMQFYNPGEGLRGDFSPCTRGDICLGDGQIELTGVHSVMNNPLVAYMGTAGSTQRYYAVVACSDTACAVGNRSIPSASMHCSNTQATLDSSNHCDLTWVPALGVNKYGILEQQVGSPSNWNLLTSNISCSTNPCTVKITTDSSTYVSGYPADNETGGVILRGAIKMGKSATQMAAVDFTYAKVTGLVVPGAVGALTYNHSGTQQTASHLVVDSCTLGTDCSVTLTGAAVFTSSASYSCVCQDETGMASCKVAQTSGSAFAIVGRGTDTIRYFCGGN